MSQGVYAALSGAMAQEALLESTAQNLANASTGGFRGVRPVFHEVLRQAQNGAPVRMTAMSGATLDMSPGEVHETGNPLDMALAPNDFLAVGTARGERYTRGGSLKLAGDGTLHAASGDPVLGEDDKPLKVPTGGVLTIETDGTVRSAGATVGRLRVVTFAQPQSMTLDGNNLLAQGGAGAPAVSAKPLRVGALEGSNASPIRGMTELMRATRLFEAYQRTIRGVPRGRPEGGLAGPITPMNDKVQPIVAAAAGAKAHVVAAKRTPTPPAQIRAAIGASYRLQTGADATKPMLDILSAHVAHETGRGASMFNYNFGGIKGTGPSGATARYGTREVGSDDQERHVVDGFRAYRSLNEGANDYVRMMKDRYPSALAAAARGDSDGFAAALKQRGYFTAHLDDYAAALRGLMHAPDGAVSALAPAAAPGPVAAPLLAAPTDPSAYVTQGVLGRVLDAVATMGAQVAAPIDSDERLDPRASQVRS